LTFFKRMLLNHYPTTNVPPYYFTGRRKFYTHVFVQKVAVWKIIFSPKTL